MSRHPPKTIKDRKKEVKKLVKAGFDYVQFDEHHYRFEGIVDFWPSTGRWRFGSHGMEGWRAENLIIELQKRVSV